MAQAGCKVNERRNETVDLGKLVPEIVQRNDTGRQQCAAEIILGEACLVCVSQHNTVAHGIGKVLGAKQDVVVNRKFLVHVMGLFSRLSGECMCPP